jgi:hypothetical protein
LARNGKNEEDPAGREERRVVTEVNQMKLNRKFLIGGIAAVVLSAGGIGIAYAVSGDSEEQASGPGADRAKAAAIEAVGGGEAVSVEHGDDGGSAYEVEVRKDDGSVVEVQVDDSGQPGATATDDDGGEGTEDDDAGGDDD